MIGGGPGQGVRGRGLRGRRRDPETAALGGGPGHQGDAARGHLSALARRAMAAIAIACGLALLGRRRLVVGCPMLVRPARHHRRTMRRRHPGSRGEAKQAGEEEQGAEHQ